MSLGNAASAADRLEYAPVVELEPSTTTAPAGISVPEVGWPHVELAVAETDATADAVAVEFPVVGVPLVVPSMYD